MKRRRIQATIAHLLSLPKTRERDAFVAAFRARLAALKD